MDLSDDELWADAHKDVQNERSLSVQVILRLLEIERREIHLDRGYPSLRVACMEEFKYARSAASDRVACVELIKDVPELEQMLVDGSISMTVAKMLRSFLEAEAKLGHIYSADQKRAFLYKLQNMSCRAVERLFAEMRPDLIAREKTRFISGDRVEMKVIMSVEDYEGLEHLKELLSHSHPSLTNGALIALMKEEMLNRIDPLRKAQRKAERAERSAEGKPKKEEVEEECRAPGEPKFGKRLHFTAEQKQKILENYDWEGCVFVHAPTGKRCGSKRCLQLDHIVPVHLGGTNDPSNIQYLCAKHNRHRAQKEHGQNVTPRRRSATQDTLTPPSPTSQDSVADPHRGPSHPQRDTQVTEAGSPQATD